MTKTELAVVLRIVMAAGEGRKVNPVALDRREVSILRNLARAEVKMWGLSNDFQAAYAELAGEDGKGTKGN